VIATFKNNFIGKILLSDQTKQMVRLLSKFALLFSSENYHSILSSSEQHFFGVFNIETNFLAIRKIV